MGHFHFPLMCMCKNCKSKLLLLRKLFRKCWCCNREKVKTVSVSESRKCSYKRACTVRAKDYFILGRKLIIYIVNDIMKGRLRFRIHSHLWNFVLQILQFACINYMLYDLLHILWALCWLTESKHPDWIDLVNWMLVHALDTTSLFYYPYIVTPCCLLFPIIRDSAWHDSFAYRLTFNPSQ